MIVSVTYLRLKNPLKLIPLIKFSAKVMQYLKTSNCISFSSSGIWLKHYTLTAWPDQDAMNSFLKDMAHRSASKASGEIASEIKLFRAELDKIPTWKEAKKMVQEKGKSYPLKK